jgi:hypothetical protein
MGLYTAPILRLESLKHDSFDDEEGVDEGGSLVGLRNCSCSRQGGAGAPREDFTSVLVRLRLQDTKPEW